MGGLRRLLFINISTITKPNTLLTLKTFFSWLEQIFTSFVFLPCHQHHKKVKQMLNGIIITSFINTAPTN